MYCCHSLKVLGEGKAAEGGLWAGTMLLALVPSIPGSGQQ